MKFDRSKYMKEQWLIARIRFQSGLKPINNYRVKGQLKFIFPIILTNNYDRNI
jgi:hypothetical protein